MHTATHTFICVYAYKNKRSLENVIISALTVKDIILCA